MADQRAGDIVKDDLSARCWSLSVPCDWGMFRSVCWTGTGAILVDAQGVEGKGERGDPVRQGGAVWHSFDGGSGEIGSDECC